MDTVIQVALDVPLARLFDYRTDDAGGCVGRLLRVPFGKGERVGLGVASGTISAHAGSLKPIIGLVDGAPRLPDDWMALVRFCADYYHHPFGQVALQALPVAVRQGAGRRRDQRLVLTALGAAQLADALPPRQKVARSLLLRLQENGAMPRSQLRALGRSLGATIRQFEAAGWLSIEEMQTDTPLPPLSSLSPQPAPPLNDAQQAAVAAVAIDGGFSASLLHGVTGSGKTEVYLQWVACCLAAGRQALLLVPEIALTPQLEARIKARFPQQRTVALHSDMADGARARDWRAAASGEADIVLGTRLSVLTPLPRLGVILVDEEHDTSFKQQDGMRYSARDVAVFRAHQLNIPVVLGSATPSLESWVNASSGRYRRLDLPLRAVAGSQLPRVRLVDVRHEKLNQGLSAALCEALEARLARNEQSLVFLNRRGYAPVLACPACGWISHCRRCAAHRVLHLADRRMRCHHCGDESAVPDACPKCGNQDILPYGAGTQRLEETLGALFPAARVLRVDRDAVRSRGQWEALLARIHAGEADILVGTQMLTKGHDFPRLTLVGVLGADSSLFSGDARAQERLFAQLMQVGGRAGRAENPGEVLIQTRFPDHPLFPAVLAHDYPAFAHSELEGRRAAGFPPFGYQALLRAEAHEMRTAIGFLHRASAPPLWPDDAEVLCYDAVPMRMARRAGRERAQLLVESASRRALQRVLTQWVPALRQEKLPRDLHWHIDVDPLEC